ncbi:hypothetical protein LCGC14_2204410 [marine sediment metagenome]|uniref:Pectate lyase superfamily protein domain-containing protein n=1 Tax=marine sediment metagenome TaxID=412755 RepID=A0A0F9DFX0_9ZZZZ
MGQQFFTNDDTGDEVKAVIDANYAELYSSARDASVYGFDPAASASVNTAAMQAALDVGGIITVITPGTYEVNDTLQIGSNTALILSPGVIFKKTGDYCNVIINKGALTKTYNENILIDGLEIEVNSVDTDNNWPVETIRGQVAFYYVRYLTFLNFKCLDLDTFQFCFTIVKWEYVEFKNIHVEGSKDCFDVGVGHDGLWEDLYISTADDGFKLYGTDYAEILTETGDIYNVTIRNYTDVQFGASTTGFTLRLLYGSWADWLNGNSYKKSDMCINAGNLYHCYASDGGFPVNGTVAPVHGSGDVKGADGITWHYLQACDFYKSDIYNVTLDNLRVTATRSATVTGWFIDDTFMRAVYPGTETLSKAYNLKIVNSILETNYAFQSFSNIKDITFGNCTFNNVPIAVHCRPDWDYNDNLYVTFTGCIFKNAPNGNMTLIYSYMEGQLVDVSMAGCRYEDANYRLLVKNANSEIRIINLDVPVSDSDLSNNLSPSVGDMCRVVSGLYIYKAGGWVNLAV